VIFQEIIYIHLIIRIHYNNSRCASMCPLFLICLHSLDLMLSRNCLPPVLLVTSCTLVARLLTSLLRVYHVQSVQFGLVLSQNCLPIYVILVTVCTLLSWLVYHCATMYSLDLMLSRNYLPLCFGYFLYCVGSSVDSSFHPFRPCTMYIVWF
jgi:hypothetical protein